MNNILEQMIETLKKQYPIVHEQFTSMEEGDASLWTDEEWEHYRTLKDAAEDCPKDYYFSRCAFGVALKALEQAQTQISWLEDKGLLY